MKMILLSLMTTILMILTTYKLTVFMKQPSGM